ncbi:MAG: hypothetical protein HLX50_00285 [Alteromonadaceae bacterium]|nr:hypothetical protein [Alteromonadaceae bacterium]
MSVGRIFKMELLDKDDPHSRVVKIKFRVENGFKLNALPGQYLIIKDDGCEFPFSIANKDDDLLDIHVKKGGSPRVEKLLEEICFKTEVAAMGPFGDAVFQMSNSPSDVVFVCAGVGYAQSHSYLRELDMTSFASVERVSLIWLVDDFESVYDHEFLMGLESKWSKFDVTLVCETAEKCGFNSVSPESFNSFLSTRIRPSTRVFVSGPRNLSLDVSRTLSQKGHDEKIVSDFL